MRINWIFKSVLVAATLGVGPAALLASPNGTSSLLRQMQSDAVNVKVKTDQLQALLREGFLNNWEDDGNYLQQVRAHVNEMDKLLYQLRVNEAQASPLQRKVIERIAPTVVNLSDTTEAAITSLKRNEGHIYLSHLDGLANDMYKQASRIGQTVGNLDKYLDARHEEQQLKQTLGLKNQS